MKSCRGFTLVELAMVLFVVSLLLGGLLVPLATQIEARQRSDAEDQLEKIREALVGFAIINGRLPCHSTESDPASPNYGMEDPVNPCNPASTTPGWGNIDGILPWKTLGLSNGLDPWGVSRLNTGDPWTGHWRYRVDQNFSSDNPPLNSLITLSTIPNDLLRIIDSNGQLLTSCCDITPPGISEFPIAIIYSTGQNQTVDGQNASYEPLPVNNPTYQGGAVSTGFDDITIWLTRPLLFNRMVSAGVLP